jgi:hypothetical protein
VPMTAFAAHPVDKFFNSNDGVVGLEYCTTDVGCPIPRAFVYKTHDGGGQWSVPIRIPMGVDRLIFIDPNNWIGVIGDMMAVHSVIRTTDAGQHWTVVASADGSYSPWDLLEAMDFIDPLHGWALGAIGGYSALLVTSDGGRTWTAEPLPA